MNETHDPQRQSWEASVNVADTAYWAVAQMMAHHTSNGCILQVGDLLGTGTQSGPQAGQGGWLEMNSGGAKPLQLSNGE